LAAGADSEDRALVRRLCAAEEAAYEELLHRFEHPIYNLVCRLTDHPEDGADVTQEVFLRIFRSLKGWDSSRLLKPWIMGIAVNRCRTWLAQRSRRPELVDYLQDTVAAQPADDSGELLTEIQSALAVLRVEYRTVFVLFHEQGQPYEEIAAALDRPVGTIKTWLHRARLELLERLRQRGMVPEEDASAGGRLGGESNQT